MSFALPSIRSGYSPSAVAGPSRLRSFSTSQVHSVSKRKLIAKRRKAANLELQASKVIKPESIDPVLGRVNYRAPSSRTLFAQAQSSSFSGTGITSSSLPPKPENEWDNSKLKGVLLNYDEIAYSPPPNYTQGERPKHLLPGISKADEDLLFGALPHISTELSYSTSNNRSGNGSEIAVEEEQNKQSEMLMRILDLRNSSKSAVNVLNRQRVIDAFGQGKDTGSSRVQAALLTSKIHNLLSHTVQNPKDTSNKRSLRLLVQERARHLKYFKRTNSKEDYDHLLADLGLESGAVEGELKFAF
ncbi:ribosomal protein S15 [Kwoniella mangroviensis CBS 10435]|uniref:Ribosomal protein S15 n=1 Tax=Kwoniella mangroviensis CBS 10435 TaxID=1331196 RepID=A0A1B9IGI6_9TREE|nr:ribosomal protein S15 [Kwoniella mangroviensis CBS 10435]OCF78652.1 ribosomal protein S15 [Kwoniella mangroviensis CBS 8886]